MAVAFEHMARQRMETGARMLKALACGLLEDGGRILFLIRKDEHGAERYEMPSVIVQSGRSPFAEINETFKRTTGIDGQVHEIVMNAKFNAGSKRRRMVIPVVVFKITARERFAKPSSEFSGFKWLTFEEAKKQKLSRNTEWIRSIILTSK